MKLTTFVFALVVAAATAIPLVTFDGAAGTTFKFSELNDPVMGGKSTGTWQLRNDTTGSYGVFDGDVVNVPSLKAPGFIKAAADGTFADAAAALGGALVLSVRSSTPEYAGFRVSFAAGTLSPAYSCAGGGSIPLSRGCFKSHFTVPAATAGNWTDIRIPFSNFTDLWSPATGQPTKTCAAEADACPTAKSLAKILRVEVWAEGVAGPAHLELRAVSAALPASLQQQEKEQQPVVVAVQTRPPAQYDTCKGAVQANLRFGISGRTSGNPPLPVENNETLAEAVCCDSRTAALAEPQFLYQAPDIQLFAKMDQTGVTTFYDSVCGLPLFRTPVNRTLAEFQADTNEHGWPSFRTGEVFTENVKTEVKMNGAVTSACGTHLGSYLPDSNGPRWCMDLSCISGNKAEEETTMSVL